MESELHLILMKRGMVLSGCQTDPLRGKSMALTSRRFETLSRRRTKRKLTMAQHILLIILFYHRHVKIDCPLSKHPRSRDWGQPVLVYPSAQRDKEKNSQLGKAKPHKRQSAEERMCHGCRFGNKRTLEKMRQNPINTASGESRKTPWCFLWPTPPKTYSQALMLQL